MGRVHNMLNVER